MTAARTIGNSSSTTIIQPSQVKHIKTHTNFSRQEVDLSKTPLFFPEGFEKIFLGIYFIILPYIAGILFLFFYVAGVVPELFLSLYTKSSFILTWAIGYEIIAGLILLYIAKMALTFANESRKPKPSIKAFRRP